MGVTIQGMMIKIEGQIQTEVKGMMMQVSGDAMLMAKGGITMIN
jgi:type VI secretion system secreted protein VgrG